jgi:hypothetical protein
LEVNEFRLTVASIVTKGHLRRDNAMAKKLLSFAAATAVLSMTLVAAPGVAQARSGVQVGVLTCQVEGGMGFVFGSSKDMRCRFEAADGRAERYVGSIDKYGIDIGVTGNAVMTWTVLAPTNKLDEGSLSGGYGGATAEVTAGVGGGANVLVGGSRKTISLQPLSLQGQTGLNAALAISSITLRLDDSGKMRR